MIKSFQVWSNESKIASWLRVLLAEVLLLAFADFVEVGAFDFSNVQLWFVVAGSATLPTLLRIINPKDSLG